MSTRAGARTRRAGRDALDLWAVQQLSALGLRMAVRTFYALAVGAVALVLVVTALVTAIGTRFWVVVQSGPPGSTPTEQAAQGLVLVLVVLAAYLAVVDAARERWTRARDAVTRSQVRGLWLALDVPLRSVLLVERGLVPALRATVLLVVLATAATVLAASGLPHAAALLSGALAVPVAGAVWCLLAATHQATHADRRARRRTGWVPAVVSAAVAGWLARTVGASATDGAAPGPGTVTAVGTGVAVAGALALVVGGMLLARRWRSTVDHLPAGGVTPVPRPARHAVSGSTTRLVALGAGGTSAHPLLARVLVLLATVAAFVLAASAHGGPLLTSARGTLAVERVAVLAGPNGTGKSTVVELLSGYLRPWSGEVLVAGQAAHTVQARALRRVCRTQPALFGAMTARDHLTYSAVATRSDPRAQLDRAATLGLGPWLDENAGTLSTGTAKKLWYLLCTAGDFQVAVLDEPFNAVDADSVDLVCAELTTWAQHRTVLVVTHAPPAALDVAHRVLLARADHDGSGAGRAEARDA